MQLRLQAEVLKVPADAVGKGCLGTWIQEISLQQRALKFCVVNQLASLTREENLPINFQIVTKAVYYTLYTRVPF